MGNLCFPKSSLCLTFAPTLGSVRSTSQSTSGMARHRANQRSSRTQKNHLFSSPNDSFHFWCQSSLSGLRCLPTSPPHRNGTSQNLKPRHEAITRAPWFPSLDTRGLGPARSEPRPKDCLHFLLLTLFDRIWLLSPKFHPKLSISVIYHWDQRQQYFPTGSLLSSGKQEPASLARR